MKQNVLQPKKRQDVRQKLKRQLQLLQQPRKKLHSRNRKIRQYMTKMETRLIRARLQQKQLQKTVEAVM